MIIHINIIIDCIIEVMDKKYEVKENVHYAHLYLLHTVILMV